MKCGEEWREDVKDWRVSQRKGPDWCKMNWRYKGPDYNKPQSNVGMCGRDGDLASGGRLI